jgi:hypothetical protein
MRQVGNMLNPEADNGLADRVIIEMDLDPTIARKLQRVEEIIGWQRDSWHSKVAEFLNRHSKEGE